LIASEMKP